MKNFLIIVFFLISQLSWGKTPESELQKLQTDVDEDYIIIYQDDWGADRLKTTLSVYDNVGLKGEPSFIITPKEISNGKDHYKFSDSFQGSCKPVCKYEFIPIDFVRIYLKNLALAVKDYKNEIARVEHNKKSYYFKFNMDWATEYTWRNYSKKMTIKKLLEEDPSYLAFVDKIKKCIKKKDLKCIKPFLDDTYLDIKKIETSAKKRAIYEDVELCEKFEAFKGKGLAGPEDVPADMLEEIKNIDFLWEKLATNLDLNRNDLYEDLKIKDFGSKIHFNSVKRLKVEACNEWLDLGFEIFKENNKWKIIGLDLYAFVD